MSFVQSNKDIQYVEATFGGSGLSFIPASDSAPGGWGVGDQQNPSWVEPLGIPNVTPNTSLLSGKWEKPRLRRRVDVKTHSPDNNHGRVTLEPALEFGGGYAVVAQYNNEENPTRSVLRRKGKVIGQTRGGEFVTLMEYVRLGQDVYLWVLTTDSWRSKLWSYLLPYQNDQDIDDAAWSPVGFYDTAVLAPVTGYYPSSGGNHISYTMRRRLAVPTVNAAKNRVCVFFYAVQDQYIMWGANNLYDSPSRSRFKFMVATTQEDPQAGLYARIRQQANWGGYIVFESRSLSLPTVHWHPVLSLPPFSTSYNFNVVFDAYFVGEDVFECTASISTRLSGTFVDEEVSNPSSRPQTFPTTKSWVWHLHSVSGQSVEHVEVLYNFGFTTLRSFFSRAAGGASALSRLRYRNWTTRSGNPADDVIDDGETVTHSVAADVVELMTENRIYYYSLKDKVVVYGRHDWVGKKNYYQDTVPVFAIYTSDMFVTTDKVTKLVSDKKGYDWHARYSTEPMNTGGNPFDDMRGYFVDSGLPVPYIYREPIVHKFYSLFYYEFSFYGRHVQSWANCGRYKDEVSFSVASPYGGRAYGSYADVPAMQRLYSYLIAPFLPGFFGHNYNYVNSFPATDIATLIGVVGDNPRYNSICLY